MSVKQSLVELPLDLDPKRIPSHVAVIMDGNGRWAKNRGLPRIVGHTKGVDALKDFIYCCDDWGVKIVTVYAFSTENWGRPIQEVEFLMTLFEKVLRRELAEMMEKKVKVCFLGNLKALPESLQKEIAYSMDLTAKNTGIQFNIASNYGSRQEIVNACKSIVNQVQQGKITIDDIDENLFEENLYTAGFVSPDLLIRTSGEMRVSNFLLWQIAYSEIYVTSTLWPDFDREEFHQALLNYQQRDRRFGKVK